jgi:hypothetical protein
VSVPKLTSSATHQQIVQHYIQYRQLYYLAELNWFRDQTSFYKAIREAALARNSKGKRLSHQRRLSSNVLITVWHIFRLRQRKLRNLKDFDSLYFYIDRLLSGLKGVGSLYRYDLALRIGAYMNISPVNVYLHAGSLIGAQKLLLQKKLPRSLDVDDFSGVFHVLSAAEIEDLLCIYKSYF